GTTYPGRDPGNPAVRRPDPGAHHPVGKRSRRGDERRCPECHAVEERGMNVTALGMSYFVELLLLPAHAYRLARMRLDARQGVQRVRVQVEAELRALEEVIRKLKAAE